MDNNKTDEITIQISCKYSIDNHRNGYFDLTNEAKLENFNNQLQFEESESADLIFNRTVEEFNLARLYLSGYDVTLLKYGKKNVFYEGDENRNDDKTEDNKSSSEDSDDSENDSEFDGGIVQKFIRTIFEDLVSLKDLNYIFSVGWTEINEQNQLLDLLNGNGLVQCFSMPQLLEALSVGLSNRSNGNSHNILSIVLEQQHIHPVTRIPQNKLSSANFCDLNHGTNRTALQNFITEPRELPMNFYNQPPPQLPPYAYMIPTNNGNYFSPPPVPPEFGFFNSNMPRSNLDPSTCLAQQQSSKLLKNAEILFSKLNLNEINEAQRKEIQEWMYLKTECDTFMPSPGGVELPPSYFGNPFMNPSNVGAQQEQSQQPNTLLPIIEMDETNDPDEDETNDNESESGSYIDINDETNDLFAKISDKMTIFQAKTDELVQQKNDEYFLNNPIALSSGKSDIKESLDEAVGGIDLKISTSTSMSGQQYIEKSGRRRSIRDNNVLNIDELNLIRKAAAGNSKETENEEKNEAKHLSELEKLRCSLKKSSASIEAMNMQIKELEKTITLKKNLIIDLEKNNKTRMTAKSNCNKKRTKYEKKLKNTQEELGRAILKRKGADEIQRLKDLTTKFKEKLSDLTKIHKITAEPSLTKETESLKDLKKQLDHITKALKDEIKTRESLEKAISDKVRIIETETGDNNNKVVAVSPSLSSGAGVKVVDRMKIRDVNARISHLTEILKEKSSNLDNKDDKKRESLRCEIRNLRKTRDDLLEHLIILMKKLKKEKSLSSREERRMLVYDESINAIDDVIETKNEIICGHKSIDTDERLEREKGEQLLMARLNKLSEEEMRILLYKYFMKVIDLKDSCKKLEQNVEHLERQQKESEWRESILKNAIQQARLESKRNLALQQASHQMKLNPFLRHFASETANSSMNESSFDTSSNSGAAALPNYEELNIMKATKSRHQYHQQQIHHQTEIDPNFKKKLFTKFMFTGFQQGPSSAVAMANKDTAAIMIPQGNLKQLKEKKPATVVTRQKNKLIIQQNDKH